MRLIGQSGKIGIMSSWTKEKRIRNGTSKGRKAIHRKMKKSNCLYTNVSWAI